MHQICRTCLNEIEDINFVNLKSDTNSSEMQSKLLLCIPELNVDLVLGPVMCTSCADALNSAYIFRTTCLRTEKLIQSYVDTKKLQPNSILLTDFNLQAYLLQARSNKGSNAALKTETIENDCAQFEFNDVNNIEDTKDIVIKEELILDDIKIEDDGDLASMQSSFTCDKCEFQTVRETGLKVHQELMHFKTFRCTECPYKTNMNSQFKNHMKLHNKGGPYQCNLCSFSTEYNLALQAHAEVHVTEQICSVCGYRSKTLHHLIEHMVATHKNDVESENIGNQKDIIMKEVILNDTEESKSDLNLDHSQHTGVKRPFVAEKSFSCNECEFETIHETSLKVHQEIMHFKKFTCNICKYETNMESHFTDHMKLHRQGCPYQCSTVCRFSTKHKPAVEIHEQLYFNEKTTCSMCGYRSKTFSSLKTHMASHNFNIVTGYILYSREVWKEAVQEDPNCNFEELLKTISSEWESLTSLEKLKWVERAGVNTSSKILDSSASPAPTPDHQKSRKKKSKKNKVTGYILYSCAVRKQVVQENPGYNFGDYSKIIGAEWCSLSELKKQEWHKKALVFNKGKY